ncbi:MAG TPA: Lrp/AsnC family transcriptional regulator [Sphingomicrobium sp.]|jgi:Lrp/AsnC family leucine-responsive transcriptional regulator|nr:Lrp/AsnC family transcriptional regulator [Sphingomicrobium sp.]
MHVSDADRRILRVLQSEGRITASELARRIGMSETSCLRRMKSLEEAGVIQAYRAVVDQRQIGLTMSAIILVSVNQRTETDRKDFLSAIADDPQIISCAAVTGSYDFALEAVIRDMDDLSDLTLRRLLELPTVTAMSTFIVHKWIKRNTPLPV